jgi:putative DNA primase/helicase
MSPLDRVLNRLESVQAQNGHFMALCPAHADRHRSLSVSEGEDGRVLIKCFTGCNFEDVVAAMGMETTDLYKGAGGRGGGYTSQRNGATVQRPPRRTHRSGTNAVAGGDATPVNCATPPDEGGYPHLRVVGGTEAQDCTLNAYAEYVGLPVDFLRDLGLKEIHYIDQKAVKIPYLDEAGVEEVCVRFRVSLAGKPKIKTRKGDKHALYGLWKIGEAREAGYVILAEGESDTQVGWHHGEPVIGVPGATGFQTEWVDQLHDIGKIYAIVEPDEGARPSGRASRPRISEIASTGSS